MRLPAAASARRFFQVAANSPFSGGGQGDQPSLLLPAPAGVSTRTQTPLRSGALGSPYQLTVCGGAGAGGMAWARMALAAGSTSVKMAAAQAARCGP